jgi:drug/metabolite transporter (DMT)-like permease
MHKNNLPVSMIALIIIMMASESIAQIFMKTGLNAIGMNNISFSNFAEFALKSATSVYVCLGLLIFFLNFFIWITVLSRVDLSVAFPICGISYIFVPMLAMIFLHETINPMRWAGIILIIAGVSLVAKSAQVETMPL